MTKSSNAPTSKKPSSNKFGKSNKSNSKFKSKDGKKTGGKKDFKKKSFTKKKKFTPKRDVSHKPDEMKETLKRKITNTDDDNESKKDKKEKKPEVVSRLMAMYESLRRKNTPTEDKIKLIDEVLAITTSKQSEIIFKHDTVRVIEMCVKYGNEKQKEQFFNLFKDNTVALATSTYARFLVEKLLEYGSKEQKRKIIESFYGKIKKLIKHKGASSIIDEIYDKYANASQKASMVEEFYGPEFAIFKMSTGRTLEDILENDPKKKELILKYMKDSLSVICQKEVLKHSIIHRALFDFFKYSDLTQKTFMIEVLKDGVVHILHTKEGARVAMNCLWYGTTKDRKSIIKTFKTYVTKICKEEYGHLVLLALFDVIDDTVLVKKALFPEIISNLDEIMLDQYGRKVLLYLLKPRSKSYFIPDILKILQQGDGNAHSKKDQSVRQCELREAVLPELLKAMVSPIKDILRNKSAAIVLLAAIEVSKDLAESISLMETIVGLIKKPLKFHEAEPGDEESDASNTSHPICDPCGHWVVKSLVQQDKIRIERGDSALFSKLVCHELAEGTLADWAGVNRGAFVVISLLETGIESVTAHVKEDLKFFKPPKEKSKGLEILTKLLKS